MEHSLEEEPRRDFASLGAHPNKLLGQNFLIDEHAIAALLDVAAIEEDDTVLEVGPGTGILTSFFAGTGARVIAVEKDPAMVGLLRKKLAGYKNVEIVQGDILTFNPADYRLQTAGYKLLGAPPYYLTARLFRTFLENQPAKPSRIAFIIQKEVAEKIVAEPPRASLLSISVRLYGKPTLKKGIARTSFWPQPEVDSALLLVDGIKAPPLDEKRFFAVARAGFAARRKQLSGNLANSFHISRQEALAWLGKCAIDPTRRAQTLTIEEWKNLSTNFPAQVK